MTTIDGEIQTWLPDRDGQYRITSNLMDVSNFSDSCLYYFLTSNYIVQSVYLNSSWYINIIV